MATKTVNVMGCVEPIVKEWPEETMDMLGSSVPIARDEMDNASFDAMMERGLKEAKAGHSHLALDVFADLKRKIR